LDRVFLDANVLFSAPYRDNSGLLWLWQRKNIRLLTSDYAMEEARRNVMATDHRERLARLMEAVEIVATPRPSPASATSAGVQLPEKDQPILAAVIRAAATHLLTGDKKHFGNYFGQTVHGILIETPAQYRCARSRRR
jgi:predicted nucleic acid-binding protein